jgi:putative oxidoreductase
MTLVRRIARPMLASVFISSGVDALRAPGPRTAAAEEVRPLAGKVPYLPDDPATLVKINAAVHVGAGTLLALGKLPRLSALALAVTLVPTTYTGHPFWRESDPQAKASQQIHFLKNVSLLGGLLLAAVDTEGRPGLAWRAQHATRTGRRAARAASVGAKAKVASAV